MTGLLLFIVVPIVHCSGPPLSHIHPRAGDFFGLKGVGAEVEDGLGEVGDDF